MALDNGQLTRRAYLERLDEHVAAELSGWVTP